MSLDPSAFQIRPARAVDADAFADQRIALFQSLGELARSADLEHLRRETSASFLEALSMDTCAVWLASDRAGAIVGSAALVFLRRFPSLQNPSRIEAYLAHMFVDPGARRRGVGSALMRTALDEARRRKLVRIRLHATDAGRQLYEQFGFRPRSNDMEIYVEAGFPS